MKGKTLFLWLMLIVLLATAFQLLMILLRVSAVVQVETVQQEGLTPVLTLYGFGRQPEDFFQKPHDVTVDKAKNLYISDTRNGRVVKLSLAGRLLRIYKQPGLMVRPLGIDVAPDGRLYVCDRFSNSLLLFDREGALLKAIAARDPLKPRYANGRLYLATRATITVLTPEGKYLYHWGRFGKKRGELAYPNGLYVDAEDHVYVSDLNNLRVQAFTAQGELLWVVGEPPKDILQRERVFGLPAGLTADGKGRLYLVDAFANAIYVLDPKDGEILAKFGGERGAGEGQFNQPSGIEWIEGNLFAVADKYNDRVQLLRIQLKETTTTVEDVRETEKLIYLLAGAFAFLVFVIYLARKLAARVYNVEGEQ